MFPGVIALFERSLRVDARAWGPHLARLGLIATIYIAVIVAVQASSMFGAPGLRFFQAVAYLDLTFMTLLGISFFATAITEEKEEDTLGLMLMAGISPLGILLGKSGGRLVQALLLVAVQYPFSLLAITMGGITQHQVVSIYVALFAYLIMLAGIGLFFSTVARRSQSASTALLLTVIAYWGVPLICREIRTTNSSSIPSIIITCTLDWVSRSSVFSEMSTVLSSGFNETVFSRQVISNLGAGGLGFLLSWALFGWAAAEPSSEANSRGMVTRSNSTNRWFSPGRPGDSVPRQIVYRIFRLARSSNDHRFLSINKPIAWKDFHFIAGGRAGVLMRFAFFAALYLICTLTMQNARSGNPGSPATMEITRLYLTLSPLAISLDAAMLVSRSLSDEIRSQTLAPLLLLPIPTGGILYAKIGGTLRCWLASAACFILGIAILPDAQECVRDYFQWTNDGPPFLNFWIAVHFVLLPHLAAAYAVFARRGAFPLAIGSTIGCLFVEVPCIRFLYSQFDSHFLLIVGIGILLICAACHTMVWRRVEALGSR